MLLSWELLVRSGTRVMRCWREDHRDWFKGGARSDCPSNGLGGSGGGAEPVVVVVDVLVDDLGGSRGDFRFNARRDFFIARWLGDILDRCRAHLGPLDLDDIRVGMPAAIGSLMWTGGSSFRDTMAARWDSLRLRADGG